MHRIPDDMERIPDDSTTDRYGQYVHEPAIVNQLAIEFATQFQRILRLEDWRIARHVAYQCAIHDAAIDVILQAMRHRRRDLYRARDDAANRAANANTSNANTNATKSSATSAQSLDKPKNQR